MPKICPRYAKKYFSSLSSNVHLVLTSHERTKCNVHIVHILFSPFGVVRIHNILFKEAGGFLYESTVFPLYEPQCMSISCFSGSYKIPIFYFSELLVMFECCQLFIQLVHFEGLPRASFRSLLFSSGLHPCPLVVYRPYCSYPVHMYLFYSN